MQRVLLLIALALLLQQCTGVADYTYDEIPRPVITEPLKREQPQTLYRLVGQVDAAEAAPLAFQVSGQVSGVEVRLGDSFEKGQVLARLDQTERELDVRQQEGLLAEARARLVQLEADYARKADLVKDSAVSQAAYEAAEAARNAGRQMVSVAESRLALARKHLDDTQLRAPFNGVVTRRALEPGQQVAAGATVLSAQSRQGLEVAMSVPEVLLSRVRVGDAMTVHFPALNNQGLPAHVIEVGDRADLGAAFPVTLLLDAQPEGLKPGMSAEIQLATETNSPYGDAFSVPMTALRSVRDGHAVYLFDEAFGVIRSHPVSLVAVEGDRAYIQGALSPGAPLVTRGVLLLHDGMRAQSFAGSPAIFPK